MMRRLLPTLAMLVLAAAPALAEEKKADTKALKGTWVREADNNKISFEFKDDKTFVCRLYPGGADDGPVVTCEYTLAKDGVMSFAITEIDKKGMDNLPDKGAKFTFKIEAGKEKLTIAEFTGDSVDDAAKQIVNGEYTKK